MGALNLHGVFLTLFDPLSPVSVAQRISRLLSAGVAKQPRCGVISDLSAAHHFVMHRDQGQIGWSAA